MMIYFIFTSSALSQNANVYSSYFISIFQLFVESLKYYILRFTICYKNGRNMYLTLEVWASNNLELDYTLHTSCCV